MAKTCAQCSQTFDVSEDEGRFLKRMAFFFGEYQALIPPPVECPECRLQIRTAHRNEQHLYPDTSDFSGKRMISLYAPEPPWGEPYRVFANDEWHGDSWDGLEFGRDYDFSRPFFEQFFELQKAVPRLGLVALNNENSPYTTGTAYCKNCHLINCSENCEDCYYGKLLQTCRNCVDCSYLYNSELCYECFSCSHCYACRYLSYSRDCTECWFSENLIGCMNCLFCTNLQRQHYCILNQPVSREEFGQRLAELLGSYQAFERAKATWHELRRKRIHKYANIVNSENSMGDFIANSRNCVDCYDVNDSRDCRYVCVGVGVEDMYDCSNVYLKQELEYQIMGALGSYHCAFSIYAFHCRDVLYSDHVFDSRDLFGCVGLKRKSFCVFNRQYGQAEFESLVPRIIEQMKSTGEWGRFFPPRFSPFCYNESLAHEYVPLTEEEVCARAWHWREEAESRVKEAEFEAIEDCIADVGEEICEKILTCEASARHYRIMHPELEFYRKHHLPVPRLSPIARHLARERLRNGRRTWERKCARCGASVTTNFAPARPETIYCEGCFQREVF